MEPRDRAQKATGTRWHQGKAAKTGEVATPKTRREETVTRVASHVIGDVDTCKAPVTVIRLSRNTRWSPPDTPCRSRRYNVADNSTRTIDVTRLLPDDRSVPSHM